MLLSLWLCLLRYYDPLPLFAGDLCYREDNLATLHIKVQNYRPGEGKVLVGVYNSQLGFLSHDVKWAVASAVVSAAGIRHGIDFLLPTRIYAVVVAQDINLNHSLDKNLFGIPKEPVGISNGFKSRLRRPTFAECALELRPPRKQIEIELVQF